MIVKILGSASSDFHGVQYNDKKSWERNRRTDADEKFSFFY